MTLDEVLSEFDVVVPSWARESAGIAKNAKLECYTDDGSGAVLVQKASHRHDLTDIPHSILQCFLASGRSLYALNEILTAESEDGDAE